jgi:hypothetical protein
MDSSRSILCNNKCLGKWCNSNPCNSRISLQEIMLSCLNSSSNQNLSSLILNWACLLVDNNSNLKLPDLISNRMWMLSEVSSSLEAWVRDCLSKMLSNSLNRISACHSKILIHSELSLLNLKVALLLSLNSLKISRNSLNSKPALIILAWVVEWLDSISNLRLTSLVKVPNNNQTVASLHSKLPNLLRIKLRYLQEDSSTWTIYRWATPKTTRDGDWTK